MKTKPKPSAATSTVRKALATRPKTAPKQPKRVKTRTAPSDPPKTGWIEIAEQKPPRSQMIVYAAYSQNNKEWLVFETPWHFTTHWLALPPPPAPKRNKEKQ